MYDGAERVLRLSRLHAKLMRDGRLSAATRAHTLLRALHECQTIFMADRDRLIIQLTSPD